VLSGDDVMALPLMAVGGRGVGAVIAIAIVCAGSDNGDGGRKAAE